MYDSIVLPVIDPSPGTQEEPQCRTGAEDTAQGQARAECYPSRRQGGHTSCWLAERSQPQELAGRENCQNLRPWK